MSEGPQCSSIAVAVRITRPVRPRERGALSETAERAPRMRGRSSLCVSWNAMTWGDLSQCRHQQQPAAPRGVVEITRLSQTWWAVSLVCVWVSSKTLVGSFGMVDLDLTTTTLSHHHHDDDGLAILGLVGSMGWSMKTSNGVGGLYWHTHIGLCSVRVNPPTTTSSISRPPTNPPPTTTTKYKCRPSLVHSHSSLISSSIINNHQQLVWNDDPLSFGVLEVWVWLYWIDELVEPIKDRILGDDDDWMWLPMMMMMANVFQQKQPQQTSKPLAYNSVTNSHHWLKH